MQASRHTSKQTAIDQLVKCGCTEEVAPGSCSIHYENVNQAYKYHDEVTPNDIVYYSLLYPLTLLMYSPTGKRSECITHIKCEL